MDYLTELQKIQDAEINFQIETLWDTGFTIRLGDDLNGYVAVMNFDKLVSGVEWLIKEITMRYPESRYVKNRGGF